MSRSNEHGANLDAASVRDATEILARALDDERAAVEARDRLRQQGLPTVEVEGAVIELLAPGEAVVAVRSSVLVERHAPGEPEQIIAGPLYLTTHRFLLLGRETLSVAVEEIRELAVAGERLLITLADHSGLSVDTSGPRVLRVEVAALLAAARA